MQDGKTVVVLGKHPITVVRRLICAFLIAWANRLVSSNLIVCSEYADELRQCTIDDLCHLASDDLAATFLLVAVRVSQVVVQCFGTFFRGFAVQHPDSIVDLCLQNAGKSPVIHLPPRA